MAQKRLGNTVLDLQIQLFPKFTFKRKLTFDPSFGLPTISTVLPCWTWIMKYSHSYVLLLSKDYSLIFGKLT